MTGLTSMKFPATAHEQRQPRTARSRRIVAPLMAICLDLLRDHEDALTDRLYVRQCHRSCETQAGIYPLQADAKRRRQDAWHFAITRRASLLAAPEGRNYQGQARPCHPLDATGPRALRREELRKLKVKDAEHARKGMPYLEVSGKGGKMRYLPLHPGTQGFTNDDLGAAGHSTDESGALFPQTAKSSRSAATSA
jgi:hypothetical protein